RPTGNSSSASGRVTSVGLAHQLDLGTAPCSGHQLCFGLALGMPRPAREGDEITLPGDLTSPLDARRADGMQLLASPGRVAEDGDQSACPDARAHPVRRRTFRTARSAPMTVRTSTTAFFPLSLDSPHARPRI